MAGEPIEQVKNGVQMLVSGLRQDPQALETAYLSVITFDSTAHEVVPLTELTAFQVPPLEASGGTSLGEGLSVVAESAKRDVAKSTANEKGDWRPMVFIMTDGMPTDNWRKGLERFRKEKWGIMVGCAVNGGDANTLKEIVGEGPVLSLDTADSQAMKAFFKWVTASVSVSSRSVEQAGKELSGPGELPPPPPELQVVV